MFASKHVMTYTLSPTNIGETHVVGCTQILLSNIPCKPCQFRGSLNFQTSILQKPPMIHGVPTCQTITKLWISKSFWVFDNLFPPPLLKKMVKKRAHCLLFLLLEACWILRAKSQKVGSAENFATPRSCSFWTVLDVPERHLGHHPMPDLSSDSVLQGGKVKKGMCKRSMPLVSFRGELLHT